MTPEEAKAKGIEIAYSWDEKCRGAAGDVAILSERIAAALLEAGTPFKIKPDLADDFDRYRMDRRAMRASHLTAHIMHLLGPHICDHEDKHHREAGRKLEQLFYQNGFDVVNDVDRAEAGLPRRDTLGWTKNELVILEHARLQAMIKSAIGPQIILPTADAETK